MNFFGCPKAKKRLEVYFSQPKVVMKEKKTSPKKNKPLKRIDFFLISGGCFVGAALLFFLLTKSLLLALVLGLLAAFSPALLEKQQQAKRSKAFNSQLTDTLTLASNSLKAGYSFLQAMDVVAREMPAPLGEEFGRALQEANLGVPIETALSQITKRVASPDFDLVLTAVLIQRQVGGNLAEILDNITQTIRERVKIQGEIRTLTAQGKISGLIIILLPLALALYLSFTNPQYLAVLFTHPLGPCLLGLGFLSEVMGAFLIWKIIKIEV